LPVRRSMTPGRTCASGRVSASRIASLIDNDGTTHLADYSYLGQASIVEVSEPQPSLKCTLVGVVGGNDPDTGDIYRGLDRFSRVKDLIWTSGGSSSSSSSSSSSFSSGSPNVVERIQHGYDRAGNRVWRAELADPADQHDEYYRHDGIHRLTDAQRGSLNAGKTGIAALTFEQCWNLDATGNWRGFQQDSAGNGVWDLVQARTANTVNEIASIVNSAGPAWAAPA